MTVATIDTSAAERRALQIGTRLDAIADNYEQVVPMISEALELRDHETLGYRSPGEYLADRFGKALGRLPIAVRRETVAAIDSVQTLSTRSLAPVFDVTAMTISNDRQAIDSRVKAFTPASTPSADSPAEPEIDLANVDMETGEIRDESTGEQVMADGIKKARKVTGLDGKTYQRPEPREQKRRTPPRRALTDQFFEAAYDMGKAIEKVSRLTADDRFPQNAEKVAAKHRNDLIRSRDLLQQVIELLPLEGEYQ